MDLSIDTGMSLNLNDDERRLMDEILNLGSGQEGDSGSQTGADASPDTEAATSSDVP